MRAFTYSQTVAAYVRSGAENAEVGVANETVGLAVADRLVERVEAIAQLTIDG